MVTYCKPYMLSIYINSNYFHGFVKVSLGFTFEHFPFCFSSPKTSFGSFCWTQNCWSLPKELVSNSLKFCCSRAPKVIKLSILQIFRLLEQYTKALSALWQERHSPYSVPQRYGISWQPEYMGLTPPFLPTSITFNKLHIIEAPQLVTLRINMAPY